MNPFSKTSTFSGLKYQFSKRTLKIWRNFTKVSKFFRYLFENYKIFNFFGAAIQIQRIFLWKICLLLNFIQKINKISIWDPEGTFEMGSKILGNSRKSTVLCGKIQGKQLLVNIFPLTGIIKKPACKTLSVTLQNLFVSNQQEMI